MILLIVWALAVIAGWWECWETPWCLLLSVPTAPLCVVVLDLWERDGKAR
jgi:hypothetical protein